MDIKDKDNMKKALGNLNISKETEDKIGRLAGDYKDKSEEDIMFEIIELNKKMEREMGEEEYNKLIKKLKTIEPFLNKEQKAKLDRVMRNLGK